jgi:hypothetical protein
VFEKCLRVDFKQRENVGSASDKWQIYGIGGKVKIFKIYQ